MTLQTPENQKTYLEDIQDIQDSLLSSPLSQALRLSPLLSPIAPAVTLTLQEFNRISDYCDCVQQQISSLEQQRDEDTKSYKLLSAHDHILGTIIADQINSLAQSTLDFSELDRFALSVLQSQTDAADLVHGLRAASTSRDFPTLHAILTNPAFILLPDSDFYSILFRIGIKDKLKKASGQD